MPITTFRRRIDDLFYSLYPQGVVDGKSRRLAKRRYRRLKLNYDGFIDGDGI